MRTKYYYLQNVLNKYFCIILPLALRVDNASMCYN